MQYKPKIIYTRINDIFESNNNINNQINFKIVGKDTEKKSTLENNLNKNINKKTKLKDGNKMKANKYINKDLIKSWINVVQNSKNLYIIYSLIS